MSTVPHPFHGLGSVLLTATDTTTTYTLDPDQYGAVVVALGLIVLLLAAILISGWRR